jgi:predicted DNA-binding antitoxin AbrB/MazE fold protein
MKTIQAIYEEGLFRPTEPVNLPEHSVVDSVPQSVHPLEDPGHIDRVAQILSRRGQSGQADIAARHDEHQL